MGVTADDYLRQEQSLLPQGPAWPLDASASITRLLTSLAQEFARVDGRATQLIEEADPRTTAELLLDWERIAGLPDPCVASSGIDQSIVQRHNALVGRITMLGGQSAAYFISLAASLGYSVTITEFHLHDVNDDVNYPLYAAPWQFAWQVNAALNTVFELTVNDSVSDALAAWGNQLLECVFSRFKPAHTTILFSYT